MRAFILTVLVWLLALPLMAKESEPVVTGKVTASLVSSARLIGRCPVPSQLGRLSITVLKARRFSRSNLPSAPMPKSAQR